MAVVLSIFQQNSLASETMLRDEHRSIPGLLPTSVSNDYPLYKSMF